MYRLPAVALLTVMAIPAVPVKLRCNYLDNPLGIDSVAPHLSWQSDSTERNWRQAAYQVLVASTPQILRSGKADVWDSGKKDSAESVGIAYAGPKLESGKRYYWNVRVWDAKGRSAQSPAPAWWEMGLLHPADWTAKWIARRDTEEETDRSSIRWIWAPGQDVFAVPANTLAGFRLEVDLPAKPRSAALYLVSRAASKATVNGRAAGAKDGRFLEFDRQDVTDSLVAGKNTVEIKVKTVAPQRFGPPSATPPPPRATVLAGLLKITHADGRVERIPTGARWQAQLDAGDWKPAAVISDLADQRMGENPGTLPGPASLMRHDFSVTKTVRSARLYVTALGSYRAFLNGHRVGNDLLTPEYTEYKKRVTYQAYDVTTLLAKGANAVAVMLGDGWFGSGMTWTGVRFSFLPPPTRLLAQIQIEYSDGSRDTVATGESWKTAPAPILHSEIYAGEVYDARLEQPGWDRPGFAATNWEPVSIAPAPPSVLSAQATLPVRLVETIKPVSIKPGPNGTHIVDMGQNMVGWIRLNATGPAGTNVRLRFAEILNPDGTLYTENLRNANQADSFYLRGSGDESFVPYFTFHGFRYVEVAGYPGSLTAAKITGEVISSAHTLTGKLQTSSDLVNQMWRVGIWGQRSNFVSVPTDCPQRDERLGWTGDAQVFWRTGGYNADIAAFGRKWMHDVVDGQSEEGAFGNTAPGMPSSGMPRAFSAYGAPGWGDAGVIVPWTAWQQFGDKGIVQENWSAMERWLKFIGDANPDFLRRNKTGANFADWLPAGSQTPRDLVGTAYWAMVARMMHEMANVLDKPAEARHYTEVYERIRSAFQKEFIKPNGEIGSGSQTSYLLALHLNLVPDALKATAVDNLVKDIEAHKGHLTTGFLGTPHLLFVLADNGRTDVAYRLLLNETYPSWGYMVKKGATTWWERWNSDTGDPAMNSFNHYAFGSVMAWVYRYVAGIDVAPGSPGFRTVLVRPRLDARMTAARGEYDSVYGKIVSDWTGTPSGPFRLKVTVPPNATAKVYLPEVPNGKVTEAGKAVEAKKEAGALLVEVGSGSYDFEVK